MSTLWAARRMCPGSGGGGTRGGGVDQGPKCPDGLTEGGGGWHKALVVGGGAYWPLALEPSAMTCLWGGGGCSYLLQSAPLLSAQGGWHKALVVGSVGLWQRLLASRQ